MMQQIEDYLHLLQYGAYAGIVGAIISSINLVLLLALFMTPRGKNHE